MILNGPVAVWQVTLCLYVKPYCIIELYILLSCISALGDIFENYVCKKEHGMFKSILNLFCLKKQM